MNALILTEKYPTNHSHAMEYVHVRNKYYIKNGIDVTVLCFSAKNKYTHEGIKVITYDTFKNDKTKYDIAIAHAANIKHHYKFIKNHHKQFTKIMFIFHGHEILRIKDTYPKPYSWNKQKTPALVQQLYDTLKFHLWHKLLLKINHKIHLVFVSNWLYSRFLYYIHINPKYLANKVSIINNPVGEYFEKNKYNPKKTKEYDFITIRGNSLDGSKYGIDIVLELAKKYPNYRYLIVGNGKFFEYNKIPNNITLVKKELKHEEMAQLVDSARCALMPTKQDTQGVLTCELASYGIPIITSNIEICKEIFKTTTNTFFIDNDKLEEAHLDTILEKINKLEIVKNRNYNAKNTIDKEIMLIKDLANG